MGLDVGMPLGIWRKPCRLSRRGACQSDIAVVSLSAVRSAIGEPRDLRRFLTLQSVRAIFTLRSENDDSILTK